MKTRQLAVRITATLKADLDGTVAGLKSVRGDDFTLREALEEALTTWIMAMRERHHDGQPYPAAELEPGRPRVRKDASNPEAPLTPSGVEDDDQ